MALLSGLRVVRSAIDGYGVIATRPFAAGELLSEVDGVAWRAGDGVDDRYSLEIDDGLYFDVVDQTRWLNHSCDPNASVHKGVSSSGEIYARLVALRPIIPGEEICYDYAFSQAVAEPCSCGSPHCRGMIIDVDLLPTAKSGPR